MKKVIAGLIGIISFLLLLGTAGGLEFGTMTHAQFIIWSLILLPIFGFSLSISSKE